MRCIRACPTAHSRAGRLSVIGGRLTRCGVRHPWRSLTLPRWQREKGQQLSAGRRSHLRSRGSKATLSKTRGHCIPTRLPSHIARLLPRILLHSHVTEQPFTRSGSTVAIEAEQTVWVRAHMHPDGYGGQALHGSVSAGFEPRSPVSGFAADLATQPPLPDDCDL